MRRFLILSLALIYSCSLAFAQGGMGPGPGTPHSSGGGGSWSVSQVAFCDSIGTGTCSGTCSGTGTDCQVALSAIGAHHKLTAFTIATAGSSLTLSGVTLAETWTHCPTCAAGNTLLSWIDQAYVLDAVGGETALNCHNSIAANGYNSCGVVDLVWSGSSATYDTSGGNVDGSCSTCAGEGLTLTGSTAAIIQIGAPNNSLTAITSPYSTNAHFYSPAGNAAAVAINIAVGTAPNWTQPSAGGAVVSAIALEGH